MVKRSCPFSDDLNPQVKIHVSEKEVANGVLRNQHMKQVYDKTKDLLFLGAKKVTAFKSSSESIMPLDSLKINNTDAFLNNSCVNQSLKQMQLTSQGRLSSSSSKQVLPISKIPCSTCRILNLTEMCSCSFCDVMLCSSCNQICMKCHDPFCTACSFNVYDASEGFICRNCC